MAKWTKNSGYWRRESLELRYQARMSMKAARRARSLPRKAEQRPRCMERYDAWLAKYRARHQA